jgi:hypothetical protein
VILEKNSIFHLDVIDSSKTLLFELSNANFNFQHLHSSDKDEVNLIIIKKFYLGAFYSLKYLALGHLNN